MMEDGALNTASDWATPYLQHLMYNYKLAFFLSVIKNKSVWRQEEETTAYYIKVF